MKHLLTQIFASAALASAASAAVAFTADFESPTYPASGGDLNGSNGWVVTSGEPAGTAFIATTTSNVGGIGGLVPIAGTVSVVQPYASDNVVNTTLSLDVLIKDSTDSFPTRDSFAISINGASGSIFSIILTPRAQAVGGLPDSEASALWDMSTNQGGGLLAGTSLGWSLAESSIYKLDLSFAYNSPTDTYFALSLFDGTTTRLLVDGNSNNLAGLAPDTDVTGFGFSYKPTDQVVLDNAGDNFLTFDNIRIVPEPSTLLLSGIAGLGFILRRKRS